MNISAYELLRQVARARGDWPSITTANTTASLPDYLLFAIGSRETNLTNEVGDFGHGHGVFQLDDRSHAIPPGFDQNVPAQARVAADMLANLYDRFGSWLSACNAYNSGRPGTSTTTGKDYGPDVLERRDCLAAALGPILSEDQDD